MRKKILLALIAVLIAASPMLVQGAQRALSNTSTANSTSSNTASSSTTTAGDTDHDSDDIHVSHESGVGVCDHQDDESAMGAAHEANQTNGHCPSENENDQDEMVRCVDKEINSTDTTISHSGPTCPHPDNESETGASHEANETETHTGHEDLNETRGGCNDTELAALLATHMPPMVHMPDTANTVLDQVKALCAE